MEYKSKISVLLVLLFKVVRSSGCGIQDLDSWFNNGVNQCNLQVYEPWTLQPWTTTDEVSAASHDDVIILLTPSSRSSCITSHILPMTDGDVIEVNVYAKSMVEEDYVTLMIYESIKNQVVGKATLSKVENNIEDGKNVVKITLDGDGHFNGYIMMTGAVSTGSVLLVESICVTSALGNPQEDIIKLTSNNRAPDIYVLQTESVLKQLVHPNVAVNRALRFIYYEDFWTPLTITLAVVIPVIILILLGWGCYALGKRNGAKQKPDNIYEDVNNLPKPYLVPRVKSAYTESAAGSSYGGRNNNIYSV